MNSDWRLQGQERYLQGVTLILAKYTRYSDKWDHDHCEFCGVKFTEEGTETPDSLHQGYRTNDKYRWICPKCFNDFKESFGWTVRF